MRGACIVVVIGIAFLGAATVVMRVGGYRYNLTSSAPIGLWRIETMMRPATVGDIVFICPPATVVFDEAFGRGYLRRGLCPGGLAPLLKTVVATSGQRVRIGENVVIDGRRLAASRIHNTDGQGRPIAAYAGGIIPAGYLFLHSSKHGSYDSRYFGPIPASGLLGRACPVLTFPPSTGMCHHAAGHFRAGRRRRLGRRSPDTPASLRLSGTMGVVAVSRDRGFGVTWIFPRGLAWSAAGLCQLLRIRPLARHVALASCVSCLCRGSRGALDRQSRNWEVGAISRGGGADGYAALRHHRLGASIDGSGRSVSGLGLVGPRWDRRWSCHDDITVLAGCGHCLGRFLVLVHRYVDASRLT